MDDNLDRRTAYAAAVIFFLIVLALLTGCTRTVKSVVETHDTIFVSRSDMRKTDSVVSTDNKALISRTDSVFSVKSRRDSVIVRDSVFVKEKGDTVYIYKERWRTKVVADKDTIVKTKTDTILLYKDSEVTVHDTVFVRDSTNHVIDSNKMIVKEKADLWSKVKLAFFTALAVAALCFLLVWWRNR